MSKWQTNFTSESAKGAESSTGVNLQAENLVRIGSKEEIRTQSSFLQVLLYDEDGIIFQLSKQKMGGFLKGRI